MWLPRRESGQVSGLNHPPAPVLFIMGFILVGTFAYAWGRGATLVSAVGVVDSRNQCCFLGGILLIAILGSTIAVLMLVLGGVAIPRTFGWAVVLWASDTLATLAIAVIFRMWAWRVACSAPRADEIGRSSGATTSHEIEPENL